MSTRTQTGLACLAVTCCLALTVSLLSGGLQQTFAMETADSQLTSEQLEFFEKRVRPLLVKRCYTCHAGTKARGGLLLDTAKGWQRGGDTGPAIVPGRPNESLLIEAVNYGSLEMPPPDDGGKLPAAEIDVLTRWIQMGAPDPRSGTESIGGMSLEEAKSWWSFQPLPDVDGAADPQHIDSLLDEALKREGLVAKEAADRRTLIRRATYDLTGLPPTTEEVGAFLADESPDAFERVVDRLLASPQYGVHWGRHWLDVVRYGDTAGENTDRPLPHAWRYRNWVFDSFNRDTPYVEFVRLQLAGDIIAANQVGGPPAGVRSSAVPAESGQTQRKRPSDNRSQADQRAEGIIATGYLAIARRFGHDIDKDMYLTHEDVIDNLGKNFLGLTLGCARCHDHKYDPVDAQDYYALYGIFESTRFAFPGCEPKGQPRDLVPLAPQSEVDALNASYQEKLASFEQWEKSIVDQAQHLKETASAASRVLAEAPVPEGKAVAIHAGRENQLTAMRKGEVLQLTVLPNANHGADTTRIQLEITLTSGPKRRTWNPEGLIDRFTSSGPALEQDGALWCLLDVSDGPVFLRDKKQKIDGVDGLQGWARGNLPSSIVTAATEPVSVWTTLPPRAFFVHPGPNQNVAVAWICPEDGTYQIRGTVTDAHPAGGLDGVSFRLEHFASAEFGAGIAAVGKQISSEPPPRPEPPAIPVAYAVVESQVRNAKFQKRGDPEQPGDEVARRWLTIFGGDVVAAEGGSGRRQLADWVAGNPLAARVMVNRIWGWHFGRGLVRSSNDFGARGEAPTHPELLDWLAARFVAGGYRIKELHRLIMLTAAYQRASAVPSQADPDNRWLSHFNRRRLTAEELRDSLLTVSGQLDRTAGESHPFPPESTWSFTQHNPFNAVYETNRRSAFLMVQRQRRHPFLALFDGADPNASTPVRDTTTVPTQALYFINDPFFHNQADVFAASVLKLNNDEPLIRHVYQSLFQRDATKLEHQRMTEFLAAYPGSDQEKWSALVRVLLASNEFLYVD